MVRYKKLARDVNSNPVEYRTWVDGYSDFNPESYTGLKSGDNSFVDPSIYMVNDPLAVVDFNMLVPTEWDTTRKTLPAAVSESQLAIIDGYSYLFGSIESNKIYRAHINNPADWVDTGASLPQHVYGSQAAVIDGYVYLFGGIVDGYPTSNVYSASTSDPLTWTNNGSLLPLNVGYSQLIVLDGYINLLGGQTDGYLPISNILQAPISSPLSWINTANTLAIPIYRSQVGILDGYVCLFGGKLLGGIDTSQVFLTPTINLNAWFLAGTLPYPCSNAQFAVVGDDGYLFATVNSGGGVPRFTSIFRCSYNSPNAWVNMGKEIPGEVSSSQLAIIYDRLFLFGGNGNSIIFASKPKYKYVFTDLKAVAYGNRSRTIVQGTIDNNDLFRNLGFPWWKTDYRN